MPDPYALSIKVCGGKDDNDAEEPEFCTAWWILVFFENYQTTFTSVFVAQPFWKNMLQLLQELSSVEGFDPATGCWEVLPSMNIRRANAGVVASEGV